MNKIKILLLSIILLFSLTHICVADDISYTFSSYAVFPTIVEPTIHHINIKKVSSISKILNAKFDVSFGSFDIATAKINYKEDSGAISSTEEIKISNQKDAFISINSQANTKIEYQIEVNFHDVDDKVTKTVYFPQDNSFITAEINSVVEEDVTSTESKTITLELGNQEFADTSIYINSGSLAASTKIIIKQLDIDSPSMTSSLSKVSRATTMIARYSITADPEVEILSPIRVNLSYGTETTTTKFNLLYRHTDLDNWEKVSIKEIDTKLKLVIADITKFGQYAICTSINLSDNDYRPSRRTIVKSRIGTNYPGFEFKYLKEGDKVNIFTISGKKIKEITAGTAEGFIWDGRKDNGDWAKSGIYIYQIKVDGKTISGTIVFVK